jgi:hypothetical protein
MVKKLDDTNLLPTFKEHSQFKRYGIWKLKFFKSPLPHVNGVQCAWHTKNNNNLWYKTQKPKVINIF